MKYTLSLIVIYICLGCKESTIYPPEIIEANLKNEYIQALNRIQLENIKSFDSPNSKNISEIKHLSHPKNWNYQFWGLENADSTFTILFDLYYDSSPFHSKEKIRVKAPSWYSIYIGASFKKKSKEMYCLNTGYGLCWLIEE